MSRKRRSYSYDVYFRAMDMINKGVGPTEISRKLDIPERTIETWKYQGKKPPLTRWVPVSSSELAYIIGVLNGDGNLYSNRRRYKIQLGVKDYDFAKTFSRIMAKTLNKRYIKPKWYKYNNEWRVAYYSKAFYIWYKEQSLESLKLYIEYSRKTAANFLRGLYDSEGNHYIYKERYSQIHLYNNNLRLLKYTQYLLEKYFNIIARGPYLHVEAGAESKMRNGKMAKTKHDNYQISIYRKLHVQRFLGEIGFSISEKQLGLPRRK